MHDLAIDFGGIPQAFHGGGASVAVPGVPAGCEHLHRSFGRLPWADLLQPALRLATDGVTMTDKHAFVLAAIAKAMIAGAGAKVWAPNGRLLAAGDHYRQPDLARTLELLAEQGADVFVEGSFADAMVEVVRADGGVLDHTDLRAYEVRSLEPARASLGGATVVGRRDLLDTVGTVGALPANIGARTVGARAVAVAHALQNHPVPLPERLGETTNVAAVDADGNACVITTSLGIGAGVWVEGYGVHLNSMLGEGELLVGEPRAGSRMASMMSPLVALDNHGLALAAGAAGASRIRTALLHVLLGALVDHADLASVVAAPRLHLTGSVCQLEPGFPAEVPEALMAAGYEVRQWPTLDHFFGGASAIGRTGAGADPRRGGGVALA
jgi:gamma-glutamyltranspeptidase/glutathione hydrolase